MTALTELRIASEVFSARIPSMLQAGDKIRFVSPASTPDREEVLARARTLENWGLVVEFGPHAFHRHGYLAGTDEQRLGDFNDALRDPTVKAIFATRGGKGSYRIADLLDFEAAKHDPKFVVGFSDITMLHLALWKNAGLVGVHGALMSDADGDIRTESADALRSILMTSEDVVIHGQPTEPTFSLTTGGVATGRMIGGNLDMVATAAGWSLPALKGCVLMLEAVNMGLGQVDRQLTMLRKSGHLDEIAGVAIGQFSGFKADGSYSIFDLLHDHFGLYSAPILGGLPLGHEASSLSVPIGMTVTLDASARTLTIPRAP